VCELQGNCCYFVLTKFHFILILLLFSLIISLDRTRMELHEFFNFVMVNVKLSLCLSITLWRCRDGWEVKLCAFLTSKCCYIFYMPETPKTWLFKSSSDLWLSTEVLTGTEMQVFENYGKSLCFEYLYDKYLCLYNKRICQIQIHYNTRAVYNLHVIRPRIIKSKTLVPQILLTWFYLNT
jgi:hypothetical protein